MVASGRVKELRMQSDSSGNGSRTKPPEARISRKSALMAIEATIEFNEPMSEASGDQLLATNAQTRTNIDCRSSNSTCATFLESLYVSDGLGRFEVADLP